MKLKEFNLGIYGTNCYLAYEENGDGVMFDMGGENLDEVTGFILKNSINLKTLVLTHGHYDHISGLNRFITLFPETEIYIHEKEAIFLKDSSYSLSQMIDGTNFQFLGEYKTFKEGDNFLGFQVIHTPGHTGGSSCLYNKEMKTLISGDTMFRRSFGRTDLPTSDTDAIFVSLKKLCDTLPSDTKVCSSHTAFTTIGEEKEFLISYGYIG